jgi:hypothetical protein
MTNFLYNAVGQGCRCSRLFCCCYDSQERREKFSLLWAAEAHLKSQKRPWPPEHFYLSGCIGVEIGSARTQAAALIVNCECVRLPLKRKRTLHTLVLLSHNRSPAHCAFFLIRSGEVVERPSFITSHRRANRKDRIARGGNDNETQRTFCASLYLTLDKLELVWVLPKHKLRRERGCNLFNVDRLQVSHINAITKWVLGLLFAVLTEMYKKVDQNISGRSKFHSALNWKTLQF